MRYSAQSHLRGVVVAAREARVRPEFALWYPGFRPDVWYPAGAVRMAVTMQLHTGSPRWAAAGRVPTNDHFEFRGGEPARRVGARTRDDDPAPARSARRRPPDTDLDL